MLAFIAPTAGRVDIDIAITLARFLVVHRRRVTIVPSLAVDLPSRSAVVPRPPSPLYSPSRRPSPPIAVVLSVHRRRARAIPCRRGVITPSLAAEEPLRCPLPSRSRVLTDSSGHSSRPSQASCPDGCPVSSPHSTDFHLPVPLIAASPFVPLVHPAGCHVS